MIEKGDVMIKELHEVLAVEKKAMLILSGSEEALRQVQAIPFSWKQWNQATYQQASKAGIDPSVDIWVFEGDFDEFLSVFEAGEAEKSCELLNQLLSAVVVEYKAPNWDVYTCNVAVMCCCVGKYLKLVNRKEWKK
jgi:hypothetical protein